MSEVVEGSGRRWVWRIALALMAILAVLIAAATAAFLLAGRFNLAGLAASRASAALGRPVAIDSLHVSPGLWITVELRGLRVENLPGGSRPDMAELESASAEIDAVSLITGPVIVRRLAASGIKVILERVAGVANWKPAQEPPPAQSPARDRIRFPTLLEVRLSGEVVFRTSSGAELRTRLDPAWLRSDGADLPVRLSGQGSYNAAPVALDAELGPIAALRDAATPYPADIRLKSGGTTLRFKGTMTNPLAIDGAHGTLDLVAPNLDALGQVAGFATDLDVALKLAGPFAHDGPVWSLSDATGTLNDGAVASATLRFDDGPRGKPDHVSGTAAFDRLDLNDLLGAPHRKGSSGQADTSLAIDRAPDTLIGVKLSAKSLAYGTMRATDVALAAELAPGVVAVDALTMTYLGARLRASGRVEATPVTREQDGGRVTATIDATGLDVQALRREVGFGAAPLLGRMELRVAVTALGTTLNRATTGARVSAVAAMTGGSVSREVVELASTDARTLIRKPSGQTAVVCALAALDMRSGVGTVLPLRIRTAEGTISGNADFDFNRRRFDLTIGSEPSTTGIFALDVPVRVAGPFSSPTVSPAKWTAAGRAKLAEGDNVGRLLPALQPFARQSPCMTGNRGR